ncbi:MAG: hypothetical protein LW862_14660 [Rubrivivax sp.]|nr:hypothetical protein [Rubrivivax sp.]
MAWTWKRFKALSLDELYDALALRCRVFVLEQGPYQDPDGLDRVSWHLLGHDGTGVLHAYLRVLADFYCGFGYTVQGDTYLEDGIPHVEMLRAAMGGYPAQRSQGGGPG